MLQLGAVTSNKPAFLQQLRRRWCELECMLDDPNMDQR